jgi:hypothetical protein
LPGDFDPIAVVIDWLDACRMRDLNMLLDLYAPASRLECECEGTNIHAGRSQLEAYWRPRLVRLAPAAFSLDEISLDADHVVLEYQSHEGKPARMHFGFDGDGKILWSRCGSSDPVGQL